MELVIDVSAYIQRLISPLTMVSFLVGKVMRCCLPSVTRNKLITYSSTHIIFADPTEWPRTQVHFQIQFGNFVYWHEPTVRNRIRERCIPLSSEVILSCILLVPN